MSHERSDLAWQTTRQTEEKFDYFMVGLAAALAGYLGQHLNMVPLGWNAPTVELASVGLLLASIHWGLKRIETTITATAAMHKQLYHGEAADALVGAAQTGGLTFNELGGEIRHARESAELAQSHQIARTRLDATVQKHLRRGNRHYHWRNHLFYAGLIALVAARVLKAYAG